MHSVYLEHGLNMGALVTVFINSMSDCSGLGTVAGMGPSGAAPAGVVVPAPLE